MTGSVASVLLFGFNASSIELCLTLGFGVNDGRNITLFIADAYHVHAADALSLVAESVLVVNDACHYHDADNVMLYMFGYPGFDPEAEKQRISGYDSTRGTDQERERTWRLR